MRCCFFHQTPVPPTGFRFMDYVTDDAAETNNFALVPTLSWQEKGHPEGLYGRTSILWCLIAAVVHLANTRLRRGLSLGRGRVRAASLCKIRSSLLRIAGSEARFVPCLRQQVGCPAYWLSIFRVHDLDATVHVVQADLGATVAKLSFHFAADVFAMTYR